jgi:disulfide bond formation protein DsbB
VNTIAAVTLFLALLTVAAQVALAGVLVLVAAGRRWPAAGDALAAVGWEALALALLVASVATAGSLYLSEVAHFVPCRLCWYQRIAMYPLVPVLGLAAWRRDPAVRPYGLVLSGIGLLIAGYHYLLERFPWLDAGACEVDNPCTLVWVRELGYVSVPLMAATAFASILVLLGLARVRTERRP